VPIIQPEDEAPLAVVASVSAPAGSKEK
jgi:hypothetical protein